MLRSTVVNNRSILSTSSSCSPISQPGGKKVLLSISFPPVSRPRRLEFVKTLSKSCVHSRWLRFFIQPRVVLSTPLYYSLLVLKTLGTLTCHNLMRIDILSASPVERCWCTHVMFSARASSRNAYTANRRFRIIISPKYILKSVSDYILKIENCQLEISIRLIKTERMAVHLMLQTVA